MASNGLTTSVSYSNEKPGTGSGAAEATEVMSGDGASSGFLFSNYKKHEDLKAMLDINKDGSKLEAMKRIIGMIAKGKDASDLFPAVVKNVVSKNIEVKKLVYVYLVRYAEEQQDLALLSISTFQRALKDPNQLIRASALRVLSSIRVPMIVPIMMLAIKEAVTDMSPYVRKTAAHAIPKLYSLDPEQKDMLIDVIDKLLADKATLVMGSAIQAFEEVCPERIDLIHKNYRKLCNLLVDVEEWGQVVLINMLTRYCRTQFIDPNKGNLSAEADRPFYDSDEDKNGKEKRGEGQEETYMMDNDHRLLLKTCQPLLNSRNASVVMAVTQLYHHCAPSSEINIVAKALIRLLREHKEVQYIVLSNIASMTITRKNMFEPFLKSFYIRSNDSTHVKLLKLEILTNLATEANISTIMREFQTYVTSSDPEFAAATIQALGRCASNIPEITEACMNGLVGLLSNRNEAVVGESVVVIKKLLQMQSSEHKSIISHLAKLVDTMTVPMAKASILWLIGEYSDRIPKIAPDVLRKVVKSFVDEDDIVKLQIVNLAAKLCIANPKQTKLLCQYVLNLAKYDQNYDIRDRARLVRQLVLPSGDVTSSLAKHAKKIFLAPKPAPLLESKFKDRNQYQLCTLSHLINAKATGYQELPGWPEVAPDPAVRNVEVVVPTPTFKKSAKKEPRKTKGFYSASESGSESSSGSGSSSGASDDDEEKSESGSTSGPDEVVEADDDDDDDVKVSNNDSPKVGAAVATGNRKRKTSERNIAKKKKAADESSEEESSSEDDSSSEESSEDASGSESEQEERQPFGRQVLSTRKAEPDKTASSSVKASDLLLDLDDFLPTGGASLLSPDMASLLAPLAPGDSSSKSKPQPNYDIQMSAVPVSTRSFELLNRVTGGGLSATYRFTRTVSVFSPSMISVEVTLTNSSDTPINDIHIDNKKLPTGTKLQEFPEIPLLAAGSSACVLLGIDVCDTTQPLTFDLCTREKKFKVNVTTPVGELIKPYTRTENEFRALQGKLSGMNESNHSVSLPSGANAGGTIARKVLETANVLPVASSQSDSHLFAGRTASTDTDVLVAVKVSMDGDKAAVTVNCEKITIGSMLAKELKTALSSAS